MDFSIPAEPILQLGTADYHEAVLPIDMLPIEFFCGLL